MTRVSAAWFSRMSWLTRASICMRCSSESGWYEV